MDLRGLTSAESDDAKRRSLATTIPHPHTKIPRTVPTNALSSPPTLGSREQWQPLTYRHRACDPRIVRRRLPLLSTTGQDPTFHGLSPSSTQVTAVQSISCSLSIGAKKTLLTTEITAPFGLPGWKLATLADALTGVSLCLFIPRSKLSSQLDPHTRPDLFDGVVVRPVCNI